MPNDETLRQHLVKLLEGGAAHADFKGRDEGFSCGAERQDAQGRGTLAMELLEHMRIAQWDILEFTRDPNHKSPEFPKGYWPDKDAPPDPKAWDRSVYAFCEDLTALCALVKDEKTDLLTQIPHGDGQTILREVLVVADHNAYHLGQMVLLRRLLGAWG